MLASHYVYPPSAEIRSAQASLSVLEMLPKRMEWLASELIQARSTPEALVPDPEFSPASTYQDSTLSSVLEQEQARHLEVLTYMPLLSRSTLGRFAQATSAYHAALPFGSHELAWLSDQHEQAGDEFEAEWHSVADRYGGAHADVAVPRPIDRLAQRSGRILTQGRTVVIDGGALVERWERWLRSEGEFAREPTAERAAERARTIGKALWSVS